jgi:thymidine phosphorylase
MEKPLAMIHAQNEKQFNEAQHIIQSAIICGTDSAQAQTQVYRHIRLPDIS